MKKKLFVLALAIVSLSVAMPELAHAKKGGNGKGHGNDKHESRDDRDDYDDHDKHDDHDNQGRDIVIIDNSNRTVIRQYIAEDYHSHCPPGLAKKHNGCQPPGQAKKHYVVGQSLPPTVIYQPVPQPLLVQLQPAPVGYQYVQVDQDVLLIGEASKKVIDAVTLLSAVR